MGLLPAAVTWMEKAGSALVLVRALVLALMILEYVPASGAFGVPESSPVVTSKVTQAGLFWMLKLRPSPSGPWSNRRCSTRCSPPPWSIRQAIRSSRCWSESRCSP